MKSIVKWIGKAVFSIIMLMVILTIYTNFIVSLI